MGIIDRFLEEDAGVVCGALDLFQHGRFNNPKPPLAHARGSDRACSSKLRFLKVFKLYNALADWWPLLWPPEDYEEEAAVYAKHLAAAGNEPARTLVEFGSGGGNNASYLKRQFQMTLVDRSAGMLAVSRKLNPDCEHVETRRLAGRKHSAANRRRRMNSSVFHLR